MKKILFLLIILFTTISCSKDGVDNENPSNNSCYDFIDFSETYDTLLYVQFINESEGWVVGRNKDDHGKNTLMKTEDAGVTWKVMNTDLKARFAPVPGSEMRFINSTDGFMIREVHASIGHRIMYTSDKGKTWKLYENPDYNGIPFSAFASNSKVTVFFSGVRVITVIDNKTKEIIQATELPEQLFKDGKNIVNEEFHISENNLITIPIFFTDGDIRMAQSSDYGLTWSYADKMNIDYVRSTSWVSDNSGFIVGDKGIDESFLYKTTDAGVNWMEFSSPTFVSMSFADENNGIGIGSLGTSPSTLHVTTDGGENWKKVSTCRKSDSKDITPSRFVSYVSKNSGAWVIGTVDNDFKPGLFHYQSK